MLHECFNYNVTKRKGKKNVMNDKKQKPNIMNEIILKICQNLTLLLLCSTVLHRALFFPPLICAKKNYLNSQLELGKSFEKLNRT